MSFASVDRPGNRSFDRPRNFGVFLFLGFRTVFGFSDICRSEGSQYGGMLDAFDEDRRM